MISNAFLPGYLSPRRRLPRRDLGDGRAEEAAGRRRGPASANSPTATRLTGVGNRRHFDATMKRELGRRAQPFGRRGRDASPPALLILDLDDFKGVNDRHGHQVGDAVLQEATASGLSALRSTDTLARIGGDEFAIIAPGLTARALTGWPRRCVLAVAGAEPDDEIPAPSASIGWAVYPDDGQDFETLMRSADDRMLSSKRDRPASPGVGPGLTRAAASGKRSVRSRQSGAFAIGGVVENLLT